MSLKEQLAAFRNERDELTNRIRQMAGKVFAEEAQHIFDTHPELASFSWTQYTPYFNDGESCEFGANTDYITVVDIHGNELDEVCKWEIDKFTARGTDWKGNPYTPSNLELAGLDAVTLLSQFENEEFLMMFGDHCRVTVHRSGNIETDDYDHD